MTVESFLTRLCFRKDNHWYKLGNDFMYLLQTDMPESWLNLGGDISNLDEKYLALIGKVLTSGNIEVVYERSDYISLAKEKVLEMNYMERLLNLLINTLPKDFSINYEGRKIIIEINRIDFDENVKIIRKARMSAFDTIGKAINTSLSITDGIREVDIESLV